MVEIDPRTRKQALFVGVGLLVCGLGMYMVHAMSRPAPAQASPALIAPVQLPESKHERSRCGGGRFRVRLSQLLWLSG